MPHHLLKVQNLQVWFNSKTGVIPAVDGVSFNIERGKTYVLLGESGSGKTVSALSICQLLNDANFAKIEGEILLNNVDLLSLPEYKMQSIRGQKIAFIFQEPMTALNPVMTVSQQISEVIKNKDDIPGLLNDVGLKNPEHSQNQYPHQLSGGMRQRVMIAMALATKPDILIADEPTTALDVTTQAQVLSIIESLKIKHNMSVLFITHDLGIVSDMADKVGVMYAGQIVEEASSDELFQNPRHPYTMRLLRSIPNFTKRGRSLETTQNQPPSSSTGCRFADNCSYVTDACRKEPIEMHSITNTHTVRCLHQIQAAPDETRPTKANNKNSKVILSLERISVSFPIKKGILKRQVGNIQALNQVNLKIKAGQTLALVGESGCGKTTLAKSILGLQKIESGQVLHHNQTVDFNNKKSLNTWRKAIQIIFQDPYSAVNPRMTIKDIVAEGAVSLGLWKDDIEQKVCDILAQVGITEPVLYRYPHEFSGGQRQRIVIARALALRPEILICDEPTSSLDVSVQAQVLNLLKSLQNKFGLSYLFITHNLHAVAWLADEIAVMYLGEIVEYAQATQIIQNPQHPYTKLLIKSLSNLGEKKFINSETNELLGADEGACPFSPRCQESIDICFHQKPKLHAIGISHACACHLFK